MPVNLQELNKHLKQLSATPARDLGRGEIIRNINATFQFLYDTGLPQEDSAIAISSVNNEQLTAATIQMAASPSPRQQRYQLAATLNDLLVGAPGADRSALTNIHENHQRLAGQIKEICEADTGVTRYGSDNAPTDPRHFTLQDRLPPHEVIQALRSTVNSGQFNSQNPVIHYLDHVDYANSKDQTTLLQTGYSLDNEICVLADDKGQPIIATCLSKSLPDNLIVTAPGKRHQILFAPDSPTGSHEGRTINRIKLIQDATEELEPNVKSGDVEKRIEQMHKQWRNLIDNLDPEKPGTLQSDLANLHQKIQETAQTIVVPGFGAVDQRNNAKELTELALLASHDRSEFQKLSFRTPTGVATRANQQPPGLLVANEVQDATGNLNIQLDYTDALGESSGREAATLEGIPKGQSTQHIAQIVLEARLPGRDVGKESPAFKGLMTFSVTEDGKAVQTGHWLSQADREAITQHSPIGLTYRDAKGSPLFMENENRTSVATQNMKDAAVYLMHGTTITPSETIWAAEMAGYDGDYLLDVDMDNLSGAAKIQIQDPVFSECSLEDIKRHMIQKITLSGHDLAQCKDMIDRIESTSWSKADDAISVALEEAHCVEQEASLGM